MIIALTPEVEHALTAEANRQQTTPELLALDCLRARFVSAAENTSVNSAGNLADYLAGHIGVLASGEFKPGGARMSEECGKKFAAGLVQKRK